MSDDKAKGTPPDQQALDQAGEEGLLKRLEDLDAYAAEHNIPVVVSAALPKDPYGGSVIYRINNGSGLPFMMYAAAVCILNPAMAMATIRTIQEEDEPADEHDILSESLRGPLH